MNKLLNQGGGNDPSEPAEVPKAEGAGVGEPGWSRGSTRSPAAKDAGDWGSARPFASCAPASAALCGRPPPRHGHCGCCTRNTVGAHQGRTPTAPPATLGRQVLTACGPGVGGGPSISRCPQGRRLRGVPRGGLRHHTRHIHITPRHTHVPQAGSAVPRAGGHLGRVRARAGLPPHAPDITPQDRPAAGDTDPITGG